MQHLINFLGYTALFILWTAIWYLALV